MGLAEYLFVKKVRYGSEESIKVIKELYEFIRNTAYKASVELAKERGSFPKFDAPKFMEASFIKKLPKSLKTDVENYGIRNVCLLSLAPNGTISLIPEVQNGIEPLFAKGYLRSDRVSDRAYIHPLTRQYVTSDDQIPDWFVDASDIKLEERLKVQATIQDYIDQAISSTINIPADTKPEDVSDVLLRYIRRLKGVTVYRDGCRSEQVLTKLSDEDILDFIKKEEYEEEITKEGRDCGSGACDL